VGNEGIEADINHLIAGFSGTPIKDLKEPGVLKELWGGLMDDVFGAKSPTKAQV